MVRSSYTQVHLEDQVESEEHYSYEEHDTGVSRPLEIEVTSNAKNKHTLPFIHRTSTIIVLIASVLFMSFAVIGYLMVDTDNNSDIIGLETIDKDMKEISLNEGDFVDEVDENINIEAKINNGHAEPTPVVTNKFSVKKQDGIMYEIIGDHLNHNKHHFTQGLTYSRHRDEIFQSNGLFRKSSVCRLNATTGNSIVCKDMPKKYFGEGMQVYGPPDNEKLIQITWKSCDGFIYDAETLDIVTKFKFETARNEGWGICYDEKKHKFIVSDGSEFLHFWDGDTLKEKYRIAVTRKDGRLAKNLNELEFVNGKVLANVWFEDIILVIDPHSGKCESEYDMSLLWPKQNRTYNADVLNGISVSKDDGILYITGKLWDRMFKLKLLGF